jgi:hypothetical protein
MIARLAYAVGRAPGDQEDADSSRWSADHARASRLRNAASAKVTPVADSLIGGVMRRPIFILGGLCLALSACAENLNPAQKRAYGAFQDCRQLAPTANLTTLSEDGSLGFESREGDYQIMIRCLSERHGYKFQ